jgi:hypothetical protein
MPARMRRGDRQRHREHDLEAALERQSVAQQQLVERRALDPLHDQEEASVELLDGMDGDDVRVVERSERVRLALEAAAGALVVAQVVGEELEDDPPLQARVERQQEAAHAAALQLLENPVGADLFANHVRPMLSAMPARVRGASVGGTAGGAVSAVLHCAKT